MTSLQKSNFTNTLLTRGNTALREKQYEIAIEHYNAALHESDELKPHLITNLKIAEIRKNKSQNSAFELELKKNDESVIFNEEYYLESNPDVRAAQLSAEEHYYNNGEREGRKPNPHFDPDYYFDINADVRAANISAFTHYCNNGHHEGRLSKSLSSKQLRSTNLNPLLFVGHDGIQAGAEIVLLEIVKWFFIHTTRRLKVLLLAPGPISDKYSEFADTYVLPGGYADNSDKLSLFLKENFEFLYLNTVVSGRFFSILDEHRIHVVGEIITHIHEMQNVIDSFPDEMQQLLDKTKLWISASPKSTHALHSRYAIKKEDIITVPAFISPITQGEAPLSLRDDARRTLGISSQDTVVVGCGTVYPRKGPDIFLETARRVNAQRAHKIVFLWIGDGPDFAQTINDILPSEKNHIRFIGNRTDANRLLACGDIFFMSSREDPFPLVVLEAAQHKIPSICFRPATGIIDFIEKDAGFILDKIGAEQATALISRVLLQTDRLEQLGKRAYEKLHKSYTSGSQIVKIFQAITQKTSYIPAVSVVVPFYNHKRFINERINSITNQTIKDIEVIILDDASTDGSKPKLKNVAVKNSYRAIFNNLNSGSPFAQWSKGVSAAKADIVWIAEGDDSCDQNFIETLLPAFNDQLVNISAARTIMMNESGVTNPNALDHYLNNAYQDKFNTSYVMDGFEEINQQFGAVCTLVNASSLLIRKSSLGSALISAQTFRMAGDWLVYLECLKNGKLSYSIHTQNYFRRHSQSQVHKLEGTETYFKEREKITSFVVENYSVDRNFLRKAFSVIDHEWSRFSYMHSGRELEDLYSKSRIEKQASFRVEKKHVALYVHGMMFSKGGIERLAAQLSNHLVSKGWKVTIFCRVSDSVYPIYPVYDAIKVSPIFDETNLAESVITLRKAILSTKVDVFIPMLSEWLFDPVVEAAQHTGVPVIVSEHNDPWKIQELWWSEEQRIKCFGKADAIHLLLNKFTESLPQELLDKVLIIPNGVSLPRHLANPRTKTILAVGRLERQKRFDRLIFAAAEVQAKLRENGYSVVIYGEGQLKAELINLINSLGLSDLVSLKGSTNNINDAYRNAKAFVMPSEFEGMGIALLEAMSFGLPSIAFSDCNGPNEIIENKISGLLVSSVAELGEALVEIADENCYSRYSDAAVQRAHAYSLDSFYTKWEEAINRVINNDLPGLLSGQKNIV